MDNSLRNLERQQATGDIDAQRKLDRAKLRAGGAPSWEYLLREYREVKNQLGLHLLDAIEQRLAACFAKHSEVIDGISWHNGYLHHMNATGWDIDGLVIHMNQDVWPEPEPVQATPDGHGEFEVNSMISHLKGECDCWQPPKGNEPHRCWAPDLGSIKDTTRKALIEAFEDILVIFTLLDDTPRELIVSSHVKKVKKLKGNIFIYTLDKGLILGLESYNQ